jgi:hypothetical protein
MGGQRHLGGAGAPPGQTSDDGTQTANGQLAHLDPVVGTRQVFKGLEPYADGVRGFGHGYPDQQRQQHGQEL